MGPAPHTVLACLAEPGRLGKQVVCPCFTPLPFSVELDAYGASLTCHVPRTYHAGSGVVRADKAGEAFTRQPWWWERRADAEAGQHQQQQFVLFVEAGRAYLPYGKPPSVRARSRARRGAAPRRHRRPTYLPAPSLAAVGARATYLPAES